MRIGIPRHTPQVQCLDAGVEEYCLDTAPQYRVSVERLVYSLSLPFLLSYRLAQSGR